MIFVWRGYGILAVVLAAVAYYGTRTLTNLALFDATFFDRHALPHLVAWWVASALVWRVGRKLNAPYAADHSLFFVKMEYWAIPLFLYGVVSFVRMLF